LLSPLVPPAPSMFFLALKFFFSSGNMALTYSLNERSQLLSGCWVSDGTMRSAHFSFSPKLGLDDGPKLSHVLNGYGTVTDESSDLSRSPPSFFLAYGPPHPSTGSTFPSLLRMGLNVCWIHAKKYRTPSSVNLSFFLAVRSPGKQFDRSNPPYTSFSGPLLTVSAPHLTPIGRVLENPIDPSFRLSPSETCLVFAGGAVPPPDGVAKTLWHNRTPNFPLRGLHRYFLPLPPPPLPKRQDLCD